jgi:hypothetical protein
MWGVLSDDEAPARSVAAYAEAMKRPQGIYGGELELAALQRSLGFSYHIFNRPRGNRVSSRMLGNEQYPVPLLFLYHTHQRHYDLVLPVRARPTGTAKPNTPVKPTNPPNEPPGPQGPPQGDTPTPTTQEAHVAGKKEVEELVSQAEGKANEPQSAHVVISY